jgi:hypothetical protein
MNAWLPYITSTVFTIVTFVVAYLRFVRNREKVQEDDRIDINQRVKILEDRYDSTIPDRVAQLEGKMVNWEEFLKMMETISKMQSDLACLTEQSKVYWEVIAPKLRDIIHSPIHKTRDALVDLLVEDKIKTMEQAQILEQELEKLWAETNDPAEQVATAVFLARTQWLLRQLSKHIAGCEVAG